MHLLLHILGIDTQQSYYYDFASGWGPKIVEMLFLGLLYWWHKTCHVPLCLRRGRYPVDGTPYTTCHMHHPVIKGRKVTHALILEHHAATLKRRKEVM